MQQPIIATHELLTFVPRRLDRRGTIFMENQNADNQQPNSADQTECLSSNSTLFWRVFMPIFGTVFLGGLLLTFLLIPEEELYLPFPLLWGQLFLLALWLGWLFLVRCTIWRLKRVDANATHFFVTNYWTTVRYPWGDVEKTEEKTRLGRRIVNLCLRAPGRFGQKISFLPGDRFEEWKRENEGVIVD
ncbi:MAG: hypothetical protein IPH31_01910 [Lewinellaceae bacterium]|nr:hypothetical protein [Lewinellaceae bacterium]